MALAQSAVPVRGRSRARGSPAAFG